MKEATVDEWDQMWDIFVHETDASEKLRLLKGLASINNPTQLTRYANYLKLLLLHSIIMSWNISRIVSIFASLDYVFIFCSRQSGFPF